MGVPIPSERVYQNLRRRHTGPDWTACQDLGVVAHALGASGINSPSATGVGDVLAVFVQYIGLGRLEPHLVEEWRSLDQLDG